MQWKNAQKLSVVTLVPGGNDRDEDTSWVTPQVNTIKVSVDAATFSKNDACGIDLVARNSDGEFVYARTALLGKDDPEIR